MIETANRHMHEIGPLAVLMGAISWASVAGVRLVAMLTPDQFSQWGAAVASVVVSIGAAIIFLVRYWQKSVSPPVPPGESFKPRGSNMRDVQK